MNGTLSTAVRDELLLLFYYCKRNYCYDIAGRIATKQSSTLKRDCPAHLGHSKDNAI